MVPVAASQVLCESSMQFEPIMQNTLPNVKPELELGNSSPPTESSAQFAKIIARAMIAKVFTQ
jgi:hypothetical protein